MINRLTPIIVLLLFATFSQSALCLQLVSIERDRVIICPVLELGLQLNLGEMDSPPTFTEPECKSVTAQKIDPQNTALWVKAKVNIPDDMRDDKQPHGIYVFGKTSSRVYFNGTYLGQNGSPGLFSKDEFVGKIDATFYTPAALIKETDNHIVLKLSSHHGFITLENPLSFIGFGSYVAPSHFFRTHLGVSLIPLGALIIGMLYFIVASFSPHQRQSNLLLLLMTSLAACQLFAEISRALFSYDYPFHDVRLLLIVSLSMGFGIGLLSHITVKLELKKKANWITMGFLLTLAMVILIPGFDSKTAIAILIPSSLSTFFIAAKAFKVRTKELFIYFFVFLAFTITIALTLASFHDTLFYYIIASVLGFLFVQQAFKLNQEQKERQAEQQQVAKLKFKLEQNRQKNQPQKIKITSAGKIELIASDQIAYCKASGDYVEIYLNDNKQLLFSGNLKELESQLPSTFLRVHRSYLVNLDFISSLSNSSRNNQPASGGFLLLEGGQEVPVSRRIIPMVRNVINNG